MRTLCSASWFASVAAAAAISLACAGRAAGQPGNPGPAVYVDLGDISIGQSVQSGYETLPVGGYVWFRFRLTQSITPLASWLDIDTGGPSGILNNEVALYDARANLIGTDNDSGGSGGPGGNGWAGAMSIGAGSGQKLSGNDPAWGGGRMSDGSLAPNLEAGVYWICIGAFDTNFPDPNPNWDTTTDSTVTGNVRVRVATGAVPATFWNERHHGTDGGLLPSTAQVVVGDGPLVTILSTFNPGGRDMFKIRVCDGAAFQAVATSTTAGGGGYRSRLFLFDATGRGVLGINNTSATVDTTLRVPNGSPPLPVGDYYLAVSTNCAGVSGFGSAVPYDEFNNQIFDFTVSNQSIPPTGPGAANPIAFWGRQSDCDTDGGYYMRLTLTGACHVQGCPADFNGDGTLNSQDFFEFLNSFFAGCP